MKTELQKQKWAILRWQVHILCAQDWIPGLTKSEKSWAVPKDAEKPAYGRKLREQAQA